MKTIIYPMFLLLSFFQLANAQFSFDASNPLAVCDEAHAQNNVRAVDDVITSTGGSFIFWRDSRANAGGQAEIYGQHLDKDGYRVWENQGGLIVPSTSGISNLTIEKWQQGLLLSYVIKQDSVMCMYLDSNGHNIWPAPVLVATKESSIIYVQAGGCFNIFPTSTGATITYYVTFIGGSTAIAYNKIDFNGNVLLANNAKTYTLSGYDYRAVSDGTNGLYILSKGNGLGSTMTIDRINSGGDKVWATGIEITNGGGILGFAGDISMNTASNHDLFVTWDAYNGSVLHTKVLKSGSLGWAFERLTLSTASNAGRCYARITNDDSVFVTWLETVNNVNNAMIQKVSSGGNIALSQGGKIIGVANYYYGYPKIAFGGSSAICFFSVPASTTIGIGAQGVTPDNNFTWSGIRVLSDAYYKWNFYADFVVLDNTQECNTIFWTGFDGNIYGGNSCITGEVLAIKSGAITVENFGLRNKISWEGYNQNAGDSYEIERSLNGINFNSIAVIQANSANSKYIFWDESPSIGVNFYRLKLSNSSGNTEYSNIVKVSVAAKKTFIITAYPNPVKNVLNIKLNTEPEKNGVLSIYDLTGKLLKIVKVNASSFTIDMTNYSPGIYIIKYSDDNGIGIVKIKKD